MKLNFAYLMHYADSYLLQRKKKFHWLCPNGDQNYRSLTLTLNRRNDLLITKKGDIRSLNLLRNDHQQKKIHLITKFIYCEIITKIRYFSSLKVLIRNE